MRFLKTILVRQVLCSVMCLAAIGCGGEQASPPNSASQSVAKTAAEMTSAEFHKRLDELLHEGGTPTEVEGVLLGGVCDATQLERAFGKPDKVDREGWSWNVKDGKFAIMVESEETRDGKRMLTINGILELTDNVGGELVQEQEAPDFDPKLTVEWPGTPEESRRRIGTGTPRETTIYSGKVTLFGPVTMFTATVHEFTEQELKSSDSKTMLKDNALQGDAGPDHTLTEIQRQDHPGFEFAGRSGTAYVRRIVVLVGRRLYRLEVLSTEQDRLKAEDVTKFFDSFKIKD